MMHGCHSNPDLLGFLGIPVVKNPPCNAGRHWFDPWSGKIPYATEQLGPCATTTTEPALQRPASTPEAHAPQPSAGRLERSPRPVRLGEALMQQ